MVNSFLEQSHHGDLEQSPHCKNTVNFLEQRHYGNLELGFAIYRQIVLPVIPVNSEDLPVLPVNYR